MEITIRPAEVGDAEALVALLEPIIGAGTYTVIESASVESQVKFLESFPERGVYNVAIDDDTGTVIGSQDVIPLSLDGGPTAHVGEISTFVALDVHRQRIGAQLCDTTFADARKKGFRKLIANIRADNKGAIAFYVLQGFRVIGTAREHVRVGGEFLDEVLAERSLLEQ